MTSCRNICRQLPPYNAKNPEGRNVMKKLGVIAGVLWMSLGVAQAQNWPEKPIRLIVPTGAGAATDIMARVLANDVSKMINGVIFVDNIAGNSGIPPHQTAARATP